MKALTLWQPWASLIAVGAKTIETRGWATSYRGPLAIHAAARKPTGRYPEWTNSMIAALGCGIPDRLPLGAVVATCVLVDCVPTEQLEPDPFGDFSPGRFGWVLRDIERLDAPVAARGRQQLWDWGPEVAPASAECEDCGAAISSGVISEAWGLRCAGCAELRGYRRAAARLRGEDDGPPPAIEQMELA